ncbi:GNAT family N-acetyltransferase [Acidobacteria bacterium AH-259-D05]|nr:GNAT family N-acetyltransferase [Acidobacteria bacterium AH-259-D05]
MSMVEEKGFHYIINQDLELRLLGEDDAEALFALTDQNREYLRQWLIWVDNIESVSEAKCYIRSTSDQFGADNGFQAGIWYQGTLAGIIGYQGVDWVNRSTTLGYWVGASFQGKGLVTEACKTLVDWAFREWRLNRLEIRCATANHRSRAIPERLGFSEEGILRGAEWLYDHFADLVVYSMLAEEWQQIRLTLEN